MLCEDDVEVLCALFVVVGVKVDVEAKKVMDVYMVCVNVFVESEYFNVCM